MPLYYFLQEKYILDTFYCLFVSLPPFLPGCELTDVIDCIENLGNWPLGPCN